MVEEKIGGTNKLRILIVDDDKDFTVSLADILTLHGYSIAIANNSDEAANIIHNFEAHVALLDIRPSRGNKIFLIPELKKIRPGIICVIITAYASIELEIKAFKHEVFDYLKKPLITEDLLTTLSRCQETIQLIDHKARAEQALRESEEKYQLLFNSMLNGFALNKMIFNDNGKPVDFQFLEVNPAFEHLTGIKKDKIIAKKVSEVLPDMEENLIEKYGNVILTGEPIRFENYSNELGCYFEVMAYRISEEQFVTIFTDISEYKKLISVLEDKIKKFESFVYSVSHDLKSPLVSIDGFSSNLLSDNFSVLDKNGKFYLERIRHNVRHMESLIEAAVSNWQVRSCKG